MRTRLSVGGVSRTGFVLLTLVVLSVCGRDVFAAGQVAEPPMLAAAARALAAQPQVQQPATPQPAPPAGPVKHLSVDEAVTMALDANLGIKADRLSPQIQDFALAQARAAWAPSFFSQFSKSDNSNPQDNFLAGATSTITDQSFANATGVSQQLPWYGGRYILQWSASRLETTSYSNFNPKLRSQLNLQYTQPLLRNFQIDTARQQVSTSQNLREIADLTLRQSIVSTTRSVRNAYWDLVFTIANLRVAQQSLDLARESLRNNRTRVEVGTMAPIDIVEAEAEVARNEESVIVAATAIERAQDQLRALVMNPTQPDFWNVRFEPAEAPDLKAQPVDVEAAVRNALENRTDILADKKNLDTTRVNVRYYRNQRLPSVDFNLSYTAVGLGGTQFEYDTSSGRLPPPIISQAQRSFRSVLGDVFTNDYANWTVGVTVGYPIGTSISEAALAEARLQQTQDETNLKNLELFVATTVRDTGRQVQTNLKRVEVTQKARELAERRLEAEQKKFTVGMSDTFRVLQAQRDLALARNAELRSVIDYNKSLVDFEAIQQAPLNGR
jgi:outer membrane protein TolC